MFLRDKLPVWLRDRVAKLNPHPSDDLQVAVVELAAVVDEMLKHYAPPCETLTAPDPAPTNPRLDEYKRAIDSLSAHLDEERASVVRMSETITEALSLLGAKSGESLAEVSSRVVLERDHGRHMHAITRANVRAPDNIGDDIERHEDRSVELIIGRRAGVHVYPPAFTDRLYFVRVDEMRARPTYNHTRGDALYDPCPECAALQSRAELHLRIRDMKDRVSDLEQQNRELLTKIAEADRAAALARKAAA